MTFDNKPIGGAGGSLPAQLSLTVPSDQDGDALHLIVDFSNNADFSGAIRLDTRTVRNGIFVFIGDRYDLFPAGGIGLEGYKGNVIIDFDAAGVFATKFIRYCWHDGTDYSDWKGVS